MKYKTTINICPKSSKNYPEHPALSKKYAKTEIFPKCRMYEALTSCVISITDQEAIAKKCKRAKSQTK